MKWFLRCTVALGMGLWLLSLDAASLRAQSSQQAILDVLPKVVKIFGAGGVRGLEHYGSGFLVSSEGHIVTVWSHVLDSDVITVVLDDGRRFSAEVLGAEPQKDVAVIKIDAEQLPYFDLSEATQAGPGTRVLAFSNVFNVAAGDEPVSVMHGVIAARTMLSARRGRFEVPYDGPVYLVDAATNNSGAAGGVLTTQDGRLLAMLGRELRSAQTNTWINYAVPISELANVVHQIQTGDFSTSGPASTAENPGRYEAADFGIVLVPDVVHRTPAYIDELLQGSPAAAAGLRPDDLIVFANNQLVPSIRSLLDELGRLEDGDELTLVVRRENQLVTITLTAPSLPRDARGP